MPLSLRFLCVLSCSVVSHSSVTPWTVARQAPLSMGFPRQEYWSGLPFPSSRDFPDPGFKPTSLPFPTLAGGFLTTGATWEAPSASCEVAQSCPTLCNPTDCSLPSSSVHRIFQARVLEWVAISFSRESSRPRDHTCVAGLAGGFLHHCTTWEAHSTKA